MKSRPSHTPEISSQPRRCRNSAHADSDKHRVVAAFQFGKTYVFPTVTPQRICTPDRTSQSTSARAIRRHFVLRNPDRIGAAGTVVLLHISPIRSQASSSAAQASPDGPAPMIPTDPGCFFPGLKSAFPSASHDRSRSAVAVQSESVCAGPESTQAPSHSTSVGQTRAQLAPKKDVGGQIVRAAPVGFAVEICLINSGTSMCVGHARMHGAS